MANPVIGYVPCMFCGQSARVSTTKKEHQLCITCPDGCAQQFTRTAAASAKIRATMKPAAAAEAPKPAAAAKPAPKKEKPAHVEEKPAAAKPGSDQPAAGGRRRFRFG